MKISDEVWVATALLQREQPARNDFSVAEILERLEKENLPDGIRSGVRTHLSAHAVASKKPNPGRYRFLTETTSGRRRLFRRGDFSHPERAKAPITPDPGDLPSQYRDLLRWYREVYEEKPGISAESVAPQSVMPLLRRFAGSLTKQEAEEMMQAIRDCEIIEKEDDDQISA